ncbi:SpoIIE family protein phosphatase [Streptomyces sp. NPDC050619]|uniref:SpoIIE family protein phosphatase n=1 Tax=Streptomyces sp. NPDC050619 TaxID=3157214 RepID=UPI003449E8B4
MVALGDRDEPGPASAGYVAAILVDAAGTVRSWSSGARDLLGRTAEEACGRPISTLLVDPSRWSLPEAESDAVSLRRTRAELRHSSGRKVEVVLDAARVNGSTDVLLLAAPVREVAEQQHAQSLMRALLAQEHIGVAIHDSELNVVRTNAHSGETGGGPPLPDFDGRTPGFLKDAESDAAKLGRVLETGVPLIADRQSVRFPDGSGEERQVSVSAFRLEDERGRPTGVATLFLDITEQHKARRRTEISHDASARIGGSLDVTRTAQAIADVLVPALGDLASVDVAEALLEGDEPPEVMYPREWLPMRRVAVSSADGVWPEGVLAAGDAIPPLPYMSEVREAVLKREALYKLSRQEVLDRLADPDLIRLTMPEKAQAVVSSPLFARGRLIGFVSVWRTGRVERFEQKDADLLFDIVARGALSLDNARRYTREHRAAVALQQRLLPRSTTRTTAAESAGSYVPAGGGADIGGDWFDVIPLPSLRVAFVVGDVIGHGLHAAATMGRLRTAIRTLADLELEPGELLIRLDDLVQQLADEADPQDVDTMGATCLYAVYDPITGTCALASAGHPPPAVIEPGGAGRLIEVSPGPLLGVGGMPFEVTTVDLRPGGTLALYTDGLVERHPGGTDQGARELLDRLSVLCREGRALEDIGHAVMARSAASPPRDDMALLLARTRTLPASDIAEWRFPDDPAVVAEARGGVGRQLVEWGLDELSFSTELIVSELVTNAIRYAGGAVGLRLFRDDTTLVCEVTDSSNTQPRLRRAQAGDEGGRGLFLVAQLARRWGSRYHRSGKTIWAEQPVGAVMEANADVKGVWDDAAR